MGRTRDTPRHRKNGVHSHGPSQPRGSPQEAAAQMPPKTLNLLSPEFDPVEALAAETIPLPFPTVTPLDNISKCRRLLPESASAAIKAEHHLVPGSKHAGAPKPPPPPGGDAVDDGTSTVEDAAGSSSAKDAASPKPTLSAQWSQSFQEGPLSMLKKLNRQKQRVRVVVRRQFGVRSVCEGQLQLFDRHLNLVLSRVTESAVIQPPGPRPAEGERWPHASWEKR